MIGIVRGAAASFVPVGVVLGQPHRVIRNDVSTRLSILSAGAAESLVTQLREYVADIEIDVTFGAVGVTKEALLAGARCELFITSERVMAELRSAGHLNAEVVGDVGWVRTGLAVRAGKPPPDVSTPNAVAEALSAAPALFSPDPVRSTAGRHFSKVLEQIGIARSDGTVLNIYPNGATAMRALAENDDHGVALGCTQVTEILQTEGVVLAGPLPQPYSLSTRYQCALLRGNAVSGGARRMYELLTGVQTAPLREELGIDQDQSSSSFRAV